MVCKNFSKFVINESTLYLTFCRYTRVLQLNFYFRAVKKNNTDKNISMLLQIQLKSLAEEMQAVNKGLEKVEQELSTSESDGPVSNTFRKVLFIVPLPPVHHNWYPNCFGDAMGKLCIKEVLYVVGLTPV